MKRHKIRGLRHAAVLGIVGVALAFAPTSAAEVDFGVRLSLPPNVHVDEGSYEPYYVGRVYYEPERAWRPVYAFPVRTPDGIVYQPYVYDGPRVVFHDYVPGPELGYVRFVREGHGHWDPHWRHDLHARNDRKYDHDRGHDKHHRDHEREYYGEW